VGSIFVVYLAGTVSSAWMGRLSDRYGPPGVISLGVAIMVLSALLTLSGNLYTVITGVAFFTFGFFGAHSVASAWVGQRAVEDKAQASSLYLLFYYAGSSIVGSVGGLFWTPYGWPGVIFMVLVLLLSSLLLAGILPRATSSRGDGEVGQA
jgi:YNFM family putative membrane transporter